jgi:hypothetical protein
LRHDDGSNHAKPLKEVDMAHSSFSSFLRCGKFALAGSIAVLSACATHPNNIKAAAYTGSPCTSADRARLATISKEQAAAARNDAVGVALIGLPLGSMGRSDHKAEIATLKGKCGA